MTAGRAWETDPSMYSRFPLPPNVQQGTAHATISGESEVPIDDFLSELITMFQEQFDFTISVGSRVSALYPALPLYAFPPEADESARGDES